VAPPDDVDALREALASLVARWRAGTLEATRLSGEDRYRVSRAARMEELADVLRSVAQ
jgi:hypothetical protein